MPGTHDNVFGSLVFHVLTIKFLVHLCSMPSTYDNVFGLLVFNVSDTYDNIFGSLVLIRMITFLVRLCSYL